MIGAMMVMTGHGRNRAYIIWKKFDPDPFMDALNKWGLPWKISEDPELVE